jgi:hypothetical protein
MAIDSRDSSDRVARIAQMIGKYHEAKHQRLVRRAIKLWSRTESDQLVTKLESQPERVH